MKLYCFFKVTSSPSGNNPKVHRTVCAMLVGVDLGWQTCDGGQMADIETLQLLVFNLAIISLHGIHW